MDSNITSLLTTLPNLAIAVWVILQYQATIKTLLENQQKLIEQLMALHPPQDAKNDSHARASFDAK